MMATRKETSVKGRLKNIAREIGKDYNFVCIQYLQERFIARLSQSAYRDHFILKGALLFFPYNIPAVRPSKDIDFLGSNITNTAEGLQQAITKVARIKLQDGVEFFPEDIDVTTITDEAEYGGFRMRIPATVAGDVQRLQLDIGFGDTIVDGPVDMEYPTILDDVNPSIKVYSLESAIAEKWQAIVRFGDLGSRMKDFFDIWFLLTNHSFETGRLREAIHSTFRQRNTPLEDSEVIFNPSFIENSNKLRQWNAFLERNDLESQPGFEEVIQVIGSHLRPIL